MIRSFFAWNSPSCKTLEKAKGEFIARKLLCKDGLIHKGGVAFKGVWETKKTLLKLSQEPIRLKICEKMKISEHMEE